MKPSNYARKITAAKFAIQAEDRKFIVHNCLTTIYFASAIALNAEFGFGKDRIQRFKSAMERVISEYGACMDFADRDYADGKLEQRYNQITKEAGIEEKTV